MKEKPYKAKCPECKTAFEIECWRLDSNQPVPETLCENGQVYCLTCIADSKCGCPEGHYVSH